MAEVLYANIASLSKHFMLEILGPAVIWLTTREAGGQPHLWDWPPSKDPGHQGSSELPWWAVCVLPHIVTGKNKCYPYDSTGKGQLEACSWCHVDTDLWSFRDNFKPGQGVCLYLEIGMWRAGWIHQHVINICILYLTYIHIFGWSYHLYWWYRCELCQMVGGASRG